MSAKIKMGAAVEKLCADFQKLNAEWDDILREELGESYHVLIQSTVLSLCFETYVFAKLQGADESTARECGCAATRKLARDLVTSEWSSDGEDV